MTHTPDAHEAAACENAQTVVHEPQWVASLPTFVSQPFAARPSQSANPVLHAPMTHDPATHAAPACANAQTVAHEPQWFASAPSMSVSQPFAARPSQFAKPALHEPITHAPAAHAGTDCGSAQAPAHDPQCIASVPSTYTSHPFAGLPSQSAHPAAHAPSAHTPPAHTLAACAKEQAPAQAPQWLASVARFASQPLAARPSQFAYPGAHAPSAHAPPAHTGLACGNRPGEHTAPHEPQLPVSPDSAVSHPLALAPSQFPKPEKQTPMAHEPAAQVGAACGSKQTAAQRPQLPASTARFASQPLRALASQLAKPALHAPREHEPATHTVPAFANCVGEHAVLHPPQWLGSLEIADSHPLALDPSQLPYPGSHAPIAQAPPAQPALACAKPHAVEQAPHRAGSAVRFASHPFAGLPSQSAKPVRHGPSEQTPATHTAPALGNIAVVHVPPQLPQWFGSTSTLVSQPLTASPSQLPYPGAHAPIVHTPPTHVAPALAKAHVVMQLPQLPGSAVMFVSQPLATMPSQLPLPARHGVIKQDPLLQNVPAAQATPQAPQFALVDARSASQPLAGLWSQSAKPGEHAPISHVPSRQTACAYANEQAAPHAPQFAGSARRLVSQPSDRPPLQSWYPGRHVLHAPPGPQARLPVVQSVFVQHALHPAAALQHRVPPAQVSCRHMPRAQTSVVHASPSMQSELRQHDAQWPPPQSRSPVAHVHAPFQQY